MGCKKVFIIVIGIILIISLLVFTIIKINEKSKIKYSQISWLKYIKCTTSCPIVKVESYDFFVEECIFACRRAYPPVQDGSISMGKNKEFDKMIYELSECNTIDRSHHPLYANINCKEKILKENSHIIDLSGKNLSVNYQTYNLSLENLVCENDKLTVSIRLIEGKDIESIKLVLDNNEDEYYQIITLSSIPEVGKTKTYDIIYNENNITSIPETVRVIIVIPINAHLIDKSYFDKSYVRDC